MIIIIYLLFIFLFFTLFIFSYYFVPNVLNWYKYTFKGIYNYNTVLKYIIIYVIIYFLVLVIKLSLNLSLFITVFFTVIIRFIFKVILDNVIIANSNSLDIVTYTNINTIPLTILFSKNIEQNNILRLKYKLFMLNNNINELYITELVFLLKTALQRK